MRLTGGGSFQDLAIVSFVKGDDVVGAEFFSRIDACDLPHFAAAVGARKNLDGKVRGGSDITRSHQVPIHTMRNDFRNAADIGGNDGDFAGHGLKRRQAERFEIRRQEE